MDNKRLLDISRRLLELAKSNPEALEPVAKNAGLAQFWDKLNAHDWYHSQSDDRRVASQGAKNERALQQESQQSKAHQDMFEAFQNHHFSGDAWKTPKVPKPERPQE